MERERLAAPDSLVLPSLLGLFAIAGLFALAAPSLAAWSLFFRSVGWPSASVRSAQPSRMRSHVPVRYLFATHFCDFTYDAAGSERHASQQVSFEQSQRCASMNRAFVNPAVPEEALVLREITGAMYWLPSVFLFSTAFLLAIFNVMRRENEARREAFRRAGQFPDEPWRWRAIWDAPIRPLPSSGLGPLSLLACAPILGAAAAALRQGSWPPLAALPVLLVATAVFALVAWSLALRLYVGPIELSFSELPLRAGASVEASLRIRARPVIVELRVSEGESGRLYRQRLALARDEPGITHFTLALPAAARGRPCLTVAIAGTTVATFDLPVYGA